MSINVAGIDASGVLQHVRRFEFDADGRLTSRTTAREATVGADGTWTLRDVSITHWPAARGDTPTVRIENLPSLSFRSKLNAGVVAAAVLPLSSMTTLELWRYSVHLDDQAQATQQVKIRFWQKALYPLSCLVMVALALPFAYLQARAGSISQPGDRDCGRIHDRRFDNNWSMVFSTVQPSEMIDSWRERWPKSACNASLMASRRALNTTRSRLRSARRCAKSGGG